LAEIASVMEASDQLTNGAFSVVTAMLVSFGILNGLIILTSLSRDMAPS
jgi:hypothetical protein